jgi:hypothetical protein
MKNVSSLKKTRGQATLSLVFLVGGIILVMSVTLAVLVISFLNSGYGFQAANRSLAAAQAGIQDAQLKLVRDSSYAGTYSFTNGSSTTNVTVTQDSPSPGQATVVADATFSGYKRKIQAVFFVNATSTEVDLISWTQLTL